MNTTKRLAAIILALVTASLFGTGPAFANYETCMRFCVAEHSFSHCNLQCGLAGGETKSSEGKKAEEQEDRSNEIRAQEDSCSSVEERVEAAYNLIQKHFDSPFMFYSENRDGLGVKFYPFEDERACRGMATFSHNCDFSIVYECEAE